MQSNSVRTSKTVSPSKRRARARLVFADSESITPDTSFEADVEVSSPAVKTPFGIARSLIRAPLALDAELVGRDTERRELLAYLRGRTPKSLYVSGTPGTGKTALVREVLAAFEAGKQREGDAADKELEHWYRELPARKVYVNCVGKDEDVVWDAILEAVEIVDEGVAFKRSRSTSPSKLTRSPTKKVKREGRKEFERWLAKQGGRW
jgi:cell division control protein 6